MTTQLDDRISPLLDHCTPQDGVIRRYVQWVTKTTHAPQLFHLGSIVPAVAYEAARRGLTIGHTHDPFRLLTCLIAGPGSAKSTAKNRAKHFVQEWYGLTTVNGFVPKPYVSLKGSLPGVLDAMMDMQIRVGAAAGTTPVIFDLDEVHLILQERQSEGILSELYDGGDQKRHLVRLQGRDNVVKKPRICGVLCGTQSALEAIVTSMQVAGGLFSRILFFRQRVREDELVYEELPEAEWRSWALDSWRVWKNHLDVLFDTQGVSRQLLVAPAADAYLKATLWEDAKKNIAAETAFAASAARLHLHARVIAATYALSETWVGASTVAADSNGEMRVWVQEDHMRRAVELVYSAGGSDGIHANMDDFVSTLGVDPVQRLAAKILAYLRRLNRGAVRADLYHAGGRKPHKAELDLAIATLLDSGIVVADMENVNGRQTQVYHLSPTAVNY